MRDRVFLQRGICTFTEGKDLNSSWPTAKVLMLMTHLLSRWKQRGTARCRRRSTAGQFRQRSRRGGDDGPSCRPDPTLSLCDRTAPPAGQWALPQTCNTEIRYQNYIFCNSFHETTLLQERTIWVVGVDVGVRGVPALNGTVHPPTEALLTAGAHGDTQHGSTTWGEAKPFLL